MSTRSFIGKRHADGSITSIYCHSDGYPKGGVGETLFEQYHDEAKLDELLSLGDLSMMGNEIGERHDFSDYSHPMRDIWTLAYGRDRGEDGIEAKTCRDLREFFEVADDYDAEFAYLYHSGFWMVSAVGGGVELEPLETVLLRTEDEIFI